MEVIILVTTKENFPKIIEFQTHHWCNGRCICCPHIVTSAKNSKVNMMSDMYLELLFEEFKLNKHNIERIIPYFNNEPFYDDRMVYILRKLKRDGHFIELSTNASLLTREIIRNIVDEHLIDDFRISFFSNNESEYHLIMRGLNYNTVKKNIEYLYDYNYSKKNAIDITICFVDLPDIDIRNSESQIKEFFPLFNTHIFGYLDRAGNNTAKNKLKYNKNDYTLSGCKLNREIERMCINYKGDAVLCSQDWKNEVILGNVFSSSINSVWTSKKAVHITNVISGFERMSEPNFICSRCKLAILKDTNGNLVINEVG